MGVKYLWQYDDQIAAYHEAGHATIANLLGGKVIEVTLRHVIALLPEDDYLTLGRVALSGSLAECIYREVSDQEFCFCPVDRWTNEALIAVQNFALCGADYDAERKWVRDKLSQHWADVEAIVNKVV